MGKWRARRPVAGPAEVPLRGRIEPLVDFDRVPELDQPQNPPLGGAVSGDERRIHALVIYYLYFDFKPQDEEPEFMIRYLMRGDVTPLVVP
jgi:hypothetical protein